MTRLSGFSLCIVLVACGSSSPPPDAATPATPIGPAGGVASGPNGVALGIPAGTVPSDVTITFAVVAPPSTSLPDGLVARGEVYRVASSVPISVTGLAGGIVLGLPIPSGLDPANLRAALLVSGGEESAAEDWSVRPGFHDSSRRLMLVRLYGLQPAGATVRLVEDVAPAPLRSTGATTVPRSAAAASDPWPAGFEVTEVAPRPPGSAGAKAFFEAQLNLALARYQAAGFVPFAIQTVESSLSLDPPSVTPASPTRYRAQVKRFHPASGSGFLRVCETSGELSVAGEYRAETRELVLCAFPTATEMQDPANVAAMIKTAFHELFHSIQAVHLGQPPPGEARYFKEGTAVLAGVWGPGSEDGVVRDTARDRRLVDVPLTEIAGQAPYDAQDFWAGLALPPRLLTFQSLTKAFLDEGDVSPARVNAVLAGAAFGTTLAHEYRGWVRRQSTVPDTCIGAVGSPSTAGEVDITEGGVTGIPAAQALQAPPLTTRVLSLGISNASSRPVSFDVAFSGDWAAPAEGGVNPVIVTELRTDSAVNITCATSTDGMFPVQDGSPRHRVTVASEGTTTVYVLGVNERHDLARTGQVSFSKEKFLLDRIEGPASIRFDTQETYSLFWTGAPSFPVTVRTRVTACTLQTCVAQPEVTLQQLTSPQPFPLRCFTTGGTASPGSFTLEATLTDAAGEQTNPVSVTVECVN